MSKENRTASVESFIATQGWTDAEVAALLREYTLNQQDDHTLLDFLETHAKTTFEKILESVQVAIAAGHLDDDQCLQLAETLLPGSAREKDNEGQFLIYTNVYDTRDVEEDA